MTDAQIQHESFTYTSEIDRLCKQNLKNLNNIINKLHLMPLKKKKERTCTLSTNTNGIPTKIEHKSKEIPQIQEIIKSRNYSLIL